MQPAGLGWTSVWRHRRKDGETVVAEVKWTPLTFRQQPAMLCLAHDITRRIRAEQQEAAMARLGRQLNSATTQLEAANLIQAVADELFGWDTFTLFLAEPDAERVTQVLAIDTINGERVELAPDPTLEVMSPRTKRVLAQGAELMLRDNVDETHDGSLLLGDKSRRSASLMYGAVRNGQRAIGVISVQSYRPRAYDDRQLRLLQTLADHCGGALERIRAEQASRENKQRFCDLFGSSPDAIFVEDEQGNVLDVNPAGCRLHGKTREELIGRNLQDLVPPNRRSQASETFARLFTGDVSTFEGESWSADGRVTPVEVRASRIHYAGQPALLLHVRDISERRRTESALQSSELLFHSVWENSVVGMRLTNERGQIVAVNDAYCRLVGRNRAQLEGQLFTAGTGETETSAELLAAHEVCFRERRVESPLELRLTLAEDKPVVWEQTSSFVELRGHVPLLLALFRDITQQKRLEDQLRQSQKMEAIGQLAGGVAHDFNNILTVIHGHASLLQAGGELTEAATRSAQQITLAAERAAGLTRQLLAFGRRQVMQARPLDFNEVVSSMTRMLARILGEDVALSVNYASQPPMVHADQSMMEQIVLNLAVNARDAMPKGGELTVTIAITEVDAEYAARYPEARAGEFVRLAVRDTGTGIAPEHLRRIFEPFFTTKEQGKGTGLGLATVYGVVRQHQGWIQVDSQLGRGTTFSVYIPLTAQPQTTSAPSLADAPVRGGDETILLVEDEEAVRGMVSRLLRNYGYQVIEANSGVRALDLWQTERERVNLLLTDIVMPGGVNGRELAEKLQDQDPHLPVIYMSGYSADVLGPEFVLRPGLNYLQKPYHPHKLAQAVRESLDERTLLARS